MTKGVPPRTWNLTVSPRNGRRSIRDRSLRRVDNCDWHRSPAPLQLQAELRAKCIAELGRSGFTAGTKTPVRARGVVLEHDVKIARQPGSIDHGPLELT